MALRIARPIAVREAHAEVPLSDGRVAIIDLADVPHAEGFNWFASSSRACAYAARQIVRSGKRTNIQLHRLISNAQPGQFVDHIDGDTLNNRRANLRIATLAENAMNSGDRPNRTGLRGVWLHGRGYYASIQKAGKKRHDGPYPTPEAAYARRRELETEMFGEFARK